MNFHNLEILVSLRVKVARIFEEQTGGESLTIDLRERQCILAGQLSIYIHTGWTLY
jgi:hypothetical protein